MGILSSFGGLSCGFEADGVNEGVDIVDDALIEAIELRSLCGSSWDSERDRAEKAGGKRRIDAFEQLQEDQADCTAQSW